MTQRLRCFLLLVSITFACPAFAQYGGYGQPRWVITYSYNGSNTGSATSATLPPHSWNTAWNNPPSQPNTYQPGITVTPGDSSNATTAGKITATLTWQANGTGIAPPDKIYVKKSAGASWSCSGPAPPAIASGGCNDGFGDPCTSTNNGLGGTSSKTVIQEYPVTGGTVVVPSGDMSANATVSVPQGSQSGTAYGVSCSFSVEVHAHPYDYREDICDTSTLSIIVRYKWKSTSGSLTNIDGVVYENVLYTHNASPPHQFLTGDDGVDYFLPEDPPFSGRFPAHQNWWFYQDNAMLHSEGSTGSMYDEHKTLSMDNYKASSFSAKQKYFFSCRDQNCPDYIVPKMVKGPHAGEFTILREITRVGSDWVYRLNKSGCGLDHTVTKILGQ